MLPTTPRLIGYLLIFVLVTVAAYAAYSFYLSDFPPNFLLINTFIFLAVFRFIQFSPVGLRNPFIILRYQVDTLDLLYVIFNFGYWFLFWWGMSLLASISAETLAVSIFAFVMITQPIAVKLGKRDPISMRFCITALIALFTMALAAVLIKLNMNAVELLSFIAFVMGQPTQLPIWYNPQLLSEQILIVGLACIIAAVLCEALGDFAVARKNFRSGSSLGRKINAIYEFKTRAQNIDNLIRNETPELLIIHTQKSVKSQISKMSERILEEEEELVRLRRDWEDGVLDYLAESEFLKLCSAVAHTIEKMRSFMGSMQQDLEKLIDLDCHSKYSERRSRQNIKDKYWTYIYDYNNKDFGEIYHSNDEKREAEARLDLLAVVGLILSFFVFLASYNPNALPVVNDWWATIISLLLLGAGGGLVRALAIVPINNIKGPYEDLVPPAFAIRPIFLSLVLLYGNASLELSWFVGALLLVLIAIRGWDIATTKIRDYKQEREGE